MVKDIIFRSDTVLIFNGIAPLYTMSQNRADYHFMEKYVKDNLFFPYKNMSGHGQKIQSCDFHTDHR